MTSKFGKRPLRTLSAQEKMEAIRRVHDGESKASVARDIGVPESTLRGWCKNEDKILYLSRQSTPDTDDSEPNVKKTKYETIQEPYNLSVKESESVLNLSKEQTVLSEREKNRAELNRLSIELGLNRPEMFIPQQDNLMNNSNLMAQWNNALSQVVTSTNKITNKIRSPTQNLLKTPEINPITPQNKPKIEPSVDDSLWHWLKTQQAMLGLMSQNQGQVDPTGSWFWKWYKQFYTQNPQNNTVLYQQLTKDTENQTKVVEKPAKSTKARAVLDNLLLNNNNNELSLQEEPKKDKKEEILSTSEALQHGEKFLKWLESFSDPAVTAMQVLQFRYLLNNVKSCTDRKNVDPTKIKVKRK